MFGIYLISQYKHKFKNVNAFVKKKSLQKLVYFLPCDSLLIYKFIYIISIQRFFGDTVCTKITRSQTFLNLILLHCWKRHLKHFPAILSSKRLVFFLFSFFWEPELGRRYRIQGIKIRWIRR